MSTLVDLSNSKNDETAGGPIYAMPATPTQVRLWQMERAAGPDAAWNVATRFRLSGPLDQEKFERSLRLLTHRHEVLRTSFAWNNNELFERIAARGKLAIEWCDLRSVSPEAQAAQLIHLSQEHAGKPFPLEFAPLFRVRMLRLAQDEHRMLWSAHHAICDGCSVGLLVQDLMLCYGEYAAGREPAERTALDYGDYAVWFDAHRRTPEYEAHRAYWKQHLQAPMPQSLPAAWRGEDSSAATSAIHSMILPRSVTDSLAALAQRHNATFFHTALTAFSLLLRAHQGQPEVALGTPFSGRDPAELEEIVGTFVNYVPLRLRGTEKELFPQVLHAVRERVSDAFEHAQFRIEDMLRELDGPEPAALDEGRLFSAVFICQQDFVHPVTAGGLTLTAVPSVCARAIRPLTVFMVERADGWRLSCEVDGRTVSDAAGTSILEDFNHLLAAIAAHPEESVAALVARARIVPASFRTQPDSQIASPHGTAPARWEPQPDALRIPATEFQRRFWQLDRMNPGAAAFHIRIRLELVGSLNVDALRSAVRKLSRQHEIFRTTLEETDGRIWQVIHPELPVDFRSFVSGSMAPDAARSAAQRLADQAILERDGQAGFSLSQGPLFRTRVLQMEKDRHWIAITLSHGVVDGWSTGLFLEQLQQAYEREVEGAPEETENPRRPQFSDHARREQSLLASEEKTRRLAWWSETLKGVWTPLALPCDLDGPATSDGDVRAGLKVTPLAADAAVAARRFARANQTTLFVVFGAAFQALLARYSGQRDVLFLTPHANRTDNTEAIVGPLADPLCVAGHVEDSLSFRDLVARFSERSMDAIENALPLNVVTPLLDMQVADGYHPLSQIIFFYQRAFVHDMEWKSLRVRSLPDAPTVTGSEWQLGVIERGEGIFLEFLYDATLYSQRTIQLATRHFTRLLTRAIAEPDRALSQIEILTPEEIRDHSRSASVLPVIQCLLPGGRPVTARAPVIGVSASAAERTPVAFSQAERDLIQLWRELFKIEEIDANSNFFDLGGHSLLLTRMQRIIKRDFGAPLTAADVFRHPTVAALAVWLDQAQAAARRAEERAAELAAVPHPADHNPRVIPIQPRGNGRPIFVISQSMIFRTLAAELGTDQPVYALQMLDEEITSAAASYSYDELIDFYVRLIREVQPTGPYRLSGWCVSGWVAYGVARKLEQMGERIELLMIIDVWAPAYWRNQPMLRRKMMMTVYKVQRFRVLLARLKRSDISQPDSQVHRNGYGWVGAWVGAARNFKSWLEQRKHPVQTPLVQEMLRRGEHLENTATLACLSGKLKGNVLLFRSAEEPTGPLLAPEMGWPEMLGRPVHVEVMPGSHHEIFALPGARMMAERAREVLGLPVASSAPSDLAGTPKRSGAEGKVAVENSPLVRA